MAMGRRAPALAHAAARSGADVVVLCWEPSSRIPRLLSSAVAAALHKPGRWKVIIAQAGTAEPGDRSPGGFRGV